MLGTQYDAATLLDVKLGQDEVRRRLAKRPDAKYSTVFQVGAPIPVIHCSRENAGG